MIEAGETYCRKSNDSTEISFTPENEIRSFDKIFRWISKMQQIVINRMITHDKKQRFFPFTVASIYWFTPLTDGLVIIFDLSISILQGSSHDCNNSLKVTYPFVFVKSDWLLKRLLNLIFLSTSLNLSIPSMLNYITTHSYVCAALQLMNFSFSGCVQKLLEFSVKKSILHIFTLYESTLISLFDFLIELIYFFYGFK